MDSVKPGEGKNITHQQKKLNEEELRQFRTRFGIPISDEEVAEAPFYRPREESPLIHYLKERRSDLGGGVPNRTVTAKPLKTPPDALFDEFKKGTDGREVSTTMAFVRILSKLLRDKGIGERIVPIIPGRGENFWDGSAIQPSSESTRTLANYTNQSMPAVSCTTRKPGKAKSWKKVLRKPDPCLPLLPLVLLTPATASI